MPLRLCSILGTLLFALSVAQPAAAQAGAYGVVDEGDDAPMLAKKRSKRARKAAADDGDRLSKRSKRKAKQEEAAEEPETTSADSAAAEEPMPEPDVWERPPVEEEKPPAPPVAKETEQEVAWADKPISAGLLVGWGFKTDRRTADLGPDPYGFGAGLRGGYTLDFALYLGVYFVWYLGSSETGDAARQNDATVTTSANYMHFGVEAGYDWWVGPLIVRPSLQIGPALAFTDNPSRPTTTRGDVMFAPGLTMVHPWDEYFLGGDLRANIVTGDGVSDVTLAATGGMRF